MSFSTVVTELQSIHAGITGITAAPTELPASLDDGRLPLVFTWPGESVEGLGLKGSAGNWYEDHSWYIVRCYVARVSQGTTGIDAGYQDVPVFLQRFREEYVTFASLNLNGNVAGLGDIEHSGAAILEYADVEYHGFEWRIEVIEKTSVP